MPAEPGFSKDIHRYISFIELPTGETSLSGTFACMYAILVHMHNKGPFTRLQLLELGISKHKLIKLLQNGKLRRVAYGWYATDESPAEAIRAVQLGGRLGCLSACKLYELWVPTQPDLHVIMNPGSKSPFADGNGVQYHWLDKSCTTAVAPLEQSLAHVLYRHDKETGLVVLESAVNQKKIHPADARSLLTHTPAKKRMLHQHFSDLSQSGSETRLRLFFQSRGVAVQPQFFIPGVGYVDLLVGKSWIIEADSETYHSGSLRITNDRERDFNARALGYTTTRLSYQQTWITWDQTQLFLRALLRTRRHLRPPRPL